MIQMEREQYNMVAVKINAYFISPNVKQSTGNYCQWPLRKIKNNLGPVATKSGLVAMSHLSRVSYCG